MQLMMLGLVLKHPKVADAGVCAIYDDEQQTELPRAYVVPAGGLESLSQQARKDFSKEVADWVAETVAGHKRLRGGVVLIDIIPKR